MVIGDSLNDVYMVMDFEPFELGKTIRTIKTDLTASEVKTLLHQLLSGVAYLHQKWYFHRDIKPSNLLYKNGVLEADLPTSILGDTPEIYWPSEEPKDLPARQALDLSTLKCVDAGKELLSMLSCPNGRRKNAIWEQYDSMVQLHTIAGPGEPAAIVEVPETERACVLTMEAEPYKCWTDPYTGAAEAMALSLRGVWLSGADALGMTNCLNFASPEFPEIRSFPKR